MDTILRNLDRPTSALHQYYDSAGVAEVLSIPPSYHDANGVRRFYDRSGRYANIAGGHRVTSYQPERFRRTIWLIGGCNIYGVGTDDARTIASYLQAFLNKSVSQRQIIVQNYGYFLGQGDNRAFEEFTILEALPVRSGDIVILPGRNVPGLYFVDASDITKPSRTCEIFFDLTHNTPDGYRLIAQKLFEGLREHHLLDEPTLRGRLPKAESTQDYGFTPSQSAELDEYRRTLIDFYREYLEPTVGAIVMNCNPFTLGHRYLIDEALKQCDYLAIFVVEEDKSFFPFEERLELVGKCTADIQNRVFIISSGRFIISSLTFSEYFNKSELQDREIDPSMDVVVFAREIAPCLHISKRFAGEEPSDAVTRQYNETMRRVLPEYGIEFVEIPRKEFAGEHISASKVREALETQDFEAIRPLVPEETFAYLLEKYRKR